MSNNNLAILVIVLVVAFIATADAYRIPRPDFFTLPWDDEQMKKHNDAHEDLWNLQQGEFNFDIVTTSKTGASNGDIWFIQTGNNVRLQWKANNHVFTVTADGW